MLILLLPININLQVYIQEIIIYMSKSVVYMSLISTLESYRLKQNHGIYEECHNSFNSKSGFNSSYFKLGGDKCINK